MGRRKAEIPKIALGPLIADNLIRLGYVEQSVPLQKIADLVATHTGRPMSRQRIGQILNSARVTDKAIRMIADALGVDPAELIRLPGHKKG